MKVQIEKRNLYSWGCSCRFYQSIAECSRTLWQPRPSCRSPGEASQQTQGILTWCTTWAFATFLKCWLYFLFHSVSFTSFCPHFPRWLQSAQNGCKTQTGSCHPEVDFEGPSWLTILLLPWSYVLYASNCYKAWQQFFTTRFALGCQVLGLF